MAITRLEIATHVDKVLGSLRGDFQDTVKGGDTEGDYTFFIDDALRDCGITDITTVTTQAQERAVIRGTEFYASRTLLNNMLSKARTQSGAGASALHIMVDWESNIQSMRLHVKDTRALYEAALSAIGRGLDASPTGTAEANIVLIDDGDDDSLALVDSDQGYPWFREGYHELG